MERQVKTTGPFGIGSMIHVVHMTDDAAELTAWYEDVFDAVTYMGMDELNYLPPEKRWATLVMISDYCIEVMAPELPADSATPVGRFYNRFGRHFHSTGYRVEDLEGLFHHLDDNEVVIGKPGGGPVDDPSTVGYFYPSPRQTHGLMVECCRSEMRGDLRLRPEWSSLRKIWARHPLGIERPSHITVGVEGLADARKVYERLWMAEWLYEGRNEALGSHSVYFQLGDSLIELAEPEDSGTHLAEHVEQFHNMIYAMTWKVTDLDSVERHLTSKGIGSSRPAPTTVLANPEDAFNAVHLFSSAAVPNDPWA
ncbi:MAG TPA: VOC family protein [Acidimicrobiales bacterium]|jgi:hypothetical protein